MKLIKSFLLLLIICVTVSAASVLSVAENPDFAKWNSISKHLVITDSQTPSNSSLKNAILKVIPEADSNRLHLLFMLEFDTFTDLSNAGVIMSVNDGENIFLYTDKTAEYNEDKYFVSTKTNCTEDTKTVFIETVLGIKDGIPEKLNLTLKIRDTEGILSNTYTVDVTPFLNSNDQTTSATQPKSETDKNRASTTEKVSASGTVTKSSEYMLLPTNQVNNTVTKVPDTFSLAGIATGIFVLVLTTVFCASHLLRRKKEERDEG